MGPICIAAGTRPEIIKLAPVYKEFGRRPNHRTIWLSTGQHTDLADQALSAFGIVPDISLRLAALAPKKTPDAPAAVGSVARVFSTLVRRIDDALASINPSMVIVQGDTTSAVAGAIAAFSRQIPIAHVEAGLRTFDLASPFPEEGWRSVLAQISTLHFAPTQTAADNLLRSGLPSHTVRVTGNTVIDGLHWLSQQGRPDHAVDDLVSAKRLVLVTMHRRENWQSAFPEVCTALLKLRDRFDDIEIRFVLHANPALRRQAAKQLADQERIRLLAPMAYPQFIQLMQRCTLILSDSGGVQEEAPAFGVPVLVLRDSTERPEAVEAGVAKLVGTNSPRILKTATRLLGDAEAHARMARTINPFGDGRAASRIVQDIERFLAKRTLHTQRTAA